MISEPKVLISIDFFLLIKWKYLFAMSTYHAPNTSSSCCNTINVLFPTNSGCYKGMRCLPFDDHLELIPCSLYSLLNLIFKNITKWGFSITNITIRVFAWRDLKGYLHYIDTSGLGFILYLDTYTYIKPTMFFFFI